MSTPLNEYTLNRKNSEIHDLMRDNGYLRDTIFRKDCELSVMRRQMEDAEKTHRFLSVILGVVLLAFLIFSLYTLRVVLGEGQ